MLFKLRYRWCYAVRFGKAMLASMLGIIEFPLCFLNITSSVWTNKQSPLSLGVLCAVLICFGSSISMSLNKHGSSPFWGLLCPWRFVLSWFERKVDLVTCWHVIFIHWWRIVEFLFLTSGFTVKLISKVPSADGRATVEWTVGELGSNTLPCLILVKEVCLACHAYSIFFDFILCLIFYCFY